MIKILFISILLLSYTFAANSISGKNSTKVMSNTRGSNSLNESSNKLPTVNLSSKEDAKEKRDKLSDALNEMKNDHLAENSDEYKMSADDQRKFEKLQKKMKKMFQKLETLDDSYKVDGLNVINKHNFKNDLKEEFSKKELSQKIEKNKTVNYLYQNSPKFAIKKVSTDGVSDNGNSGSVVDPALTDPTHVKPMTVYDKHFEPLGRLPVKGMSSPKHFQNIYSKDGYQVSSKIRYPAKMNIIAEIITGCHVNIEKCIGTKLFFFLIKTNF